MMAAKRRAKKKPAPRKRGKKKPSRGRKKKAPAAKAPAGSIVAFAEARRHVDLIKKAQGPKGLTSPELAELKRYEAARAAREREDEALRTRPKPPTEEQLPLSPDLGGLDAIESMQRRLIAASVPAGAPLLVMTQEQLAAIYGVSIRTVENWAAEPDWPEGRKGPYDLAVLGPWFRARIAAAVKPQNGEARTLDAIRQQNLEIGALALQERQGKLISREEVRATWRELWSLVRGATERLGKKCASTCGKRFTDLVTAELVRIEKEAVRRLPAEEEKEGER